MKIDLQAIKVKGRKGRELSGWRALLIYILGIIMSIFSIYFLGFGFIHPWLFRAGHLMFALVLVYLICPANSRSPKDRFSTPDLILSIFPVVTFLYLLSDIQGVAMRASVAPSGMDIIFAVLTVVGVIEASRRFFGWALPGVALIFLLYAFLGEFIPGPFRAPDYNYERIASYMFSTSGIYGISLATAANYVFLFILFGAFLQRTGVGDVFIDVANGVAGRFRGGPAKASILSSALFGSISGSAQANVVTTGSMTIPMMRRIGYPNSFAAGIETTASLGGLFLPPIMGAGGFLMADILSIPYSEVIKHAIIPALLYYIAILIAVDFMAGKLGMRGMPKEEVPNLWKTIMKKGYLLLPLVLLIWLLLEGVPTTRVGLWTILAVSIIGFIAPGIKFGIREVLDALSEGARSALNASIATATAGLVVGVMSMTGLGLTVESLMMELGGTSLMLSLLVAALVCILLGMDLPITATYITVAALLAPGLVSLGIPPIAAHLFLYILAATSGMTPPIAVTAYAAAGVSGADPMKIAFQSIRLGWVAYIIPFMFVFAPSLLLMGTPGTVVISFITAVLGIAAVSAGMTGFLVGSLSMIERIPLVLGGLAVVYPGEITNYIGIGIIVAVTIYHYFFQRKNKKIPSTTLSNKEGNL